MCDCKAASNLKSYTHQTERTVDLQTSTQDILHAGGSKTRHPENRLNRKESSSSPANAISAAQKESVSIAQLEVVPKEGSRQGTDTKSCIVLNQADQKGGPVQLLQPMWLARQRYVFGRSRSRLSILRAEDGKMMLTAKPRTVTLTVHYSFLQTQYRVFTYIIS